MEPVTVFMLTLTVGALAKSISERLTDARKIGEQLREFADDLRALQKVIAEVSALLDQPLIKQTLDQAPAGGIVAAIRYDFQVCQSFIEEDLSRMKDESSSMRSRIKRYAGAKKASSSTTELKKKLRDHIMRAQIGLQILNLIPGSMAALETQIRSLQVLVRQLSANDTIRNRDGESASVSGPSRSMIHVGAVENLEDAALSTLEQADQALVLWRSQGPSASPLGTRTTSHGANSYRYDYGDGTSSDANSMRDSLRPRDPYSMVEEYYNGRDYSGGRYDYETPRSEYSSRSHRSPTISTENSRLSRKPVNKSQMQSPDPVLQSFRKKKNKTKLIAVCGMTGSGKSSFISKLVGKDVGIGHGLHSQTSEIREESFEFDSSTGSHIVTLIDTPGFADTATSESDVLGRIAAWMERSYRDDTLLSGIIYLHPINHNRMDGPSTQNIRMFRKLCGEKSMRNVVLATTMWQADESSAQFEDREEALKNDFWKEMIDKGAKVLRYTNTKSSAGAMIAELIGNEPLELDIQVELVDKNMELVDTGAGACVNADLEKLKAKHEEELNFIREDMEDLVLDNEAAKREHHELNEKYDKTFAKMKKAEQDMQALHRREINDLHSKLEDNEMQQANQAHVHRQELLDHRKETERQAKEMERQAKLNRQALKDQQKESDNKFRQQGKEMNRMQQEMNELSRAAQLENKNAAEERARFQNAVGQMQSAHERMAQQEHSMRRENEGLRVINNEITNNNNNGGGGGSSSSHGPGYDGSYGGPSSDGRISKRTGETRPPPPEPVLKKLPKTIKGNRYSVAKRHQVEYENQLLMAEHQKRLDKYYAN